MLVNEPQAANQDDGALLHPSSRALFRFWEAIRAENAAPRRADLDLRQIRGLIPHLFIADYDQRKMRYRWRLAGTGICELYRCELTGGDVLAGWDSFERGVMSRFLGGVAGKLQPCVFRLRLTTDYGQTIGAEMVGLPVAAADGRAIHIFGGIFPFVDLSSVYYQQIAGLELSSARSIWTEPLPGDQLLAQTAGPPGQPAFHPFQVIAGGRTAN